ncbi:MAG: LysR family transcriptional regulator, partial [Alteromonadaceae bacterium]|nr:LysR family transcriptional regulator [Alteromonadaceae bacterium]
AAELAISPTAVSHHINKLEQRLSVTLFERSARKVTLTELGKELAVATSEGFYTIQLALDNIAVKEKQVNVSTTSAFAALVLIPALQDFYANYPQVNVNITSGENIEANSFTLAIRLGDVNQQSPGEIIKTEQFDLFCTASSAPAFNQTKPLTIYTTQWKNTALPAVPWEEWLQRNQVPNKNIEMRYFDQELFGIQQALQENAFVFCSNTLVQSYLKAGLLERLTTQPVDSQLCYYIADKDKRLSRHNMMFVEWLEKQLK